ncbi:unnamed protein product [Schistosoma curassoni]|uniref:Cilia- and flagella-associated protein 300 n=1 Tax=Schistosoma curassoni TaxID=6186 RepID=A0A183KJV5_9TREM|nr:unnamed protein product [Schistosoma curassoni]
MEKLDIHSTSEAFEDYFERLEIWAMTKEDIEDLNIVAHFLTFIGKGAYSLSLSTISKDSVESNSSSELNETQNSCEITVSNQSTYQISHVIVPDMVFLNDSLISDEIPCKSEENMLNKPKESNPDVILNIICPHDAFVSCGKLVQCEAQVLNELDFDYNSDDFISTAVYPYHKNTSNVYSNQCEKYDLNEATSFINWGYKDPTLFRGGGYSKSLWFKF